MSGTRREQLVCTARLAEQIECFRDVADAMASVVKEAAGDLSLEERNLLAVGFKHLVVGDRISWKKLGEIQQGFVSLTDKKKNDDGSSKHKKMMAAAHQYRNAIEERIIANCDQIILLLKQHILPLAHPALAKIVPEIVESSKNFRSKGFETVEACLKAQLQERVLTRMDVVGDLDSRAGENLVFYYKMIADYYRFLAEISLEREEDGEDFDEQEHLRPVSSNGSGTGASHQSLCFYYLATQIGKLHLPPSHPVRLGLALNFAVFYYEIVQKPEHAYRVAESSYDYAVSEFSGADKSVFKESEYIMQLIKENLRQWTALDE
jgi:14-3-3 protein epsilon